MRKNGFDAPVRQQRPMGERSQLLSRFSAAESGVVALLFALMVPVLLGFVGLGVEVGFWYSEKRNLQSVADAGAVGGGYEVRSDSSTGTINTVAQQDAVRNGLNIAGGDTFFVNMPPTSGAYTGSDLAVEVLVTRPIVLLFSRYFGDGSNTMAARAVVDLGTTTEACVLALDPTATAALSNTGGAVINLDGCSVAVNSDDDRALDIGGGSLLTTECVSVVGGYRESGGGEIDTTECAEPLTGMRAVEDPYEDYPEPTIGACLMGANQYHATDETISPGTYCRGINISGTVIMQSGVYVIDRGTFTVNSGAILTSEAGGVTIFLTSSTGNSYASVTINGGADVTLAAQSSGNYSGLLFYGDDDTPSSPPNNNILNGGSTMDLTGALYFPGGHVNYTGGASLTGSCVQIIAQTIDFSGDADMNLDCPGAGMASAAIYDEVKLVE